MNYKGEQDAFLTFFQPGADLLEAALAYASLRLFVFPLQPNSKKPYPKTRGWHDATTNTERIKSWWSKNPTSNIGIALRYSGLVVLDVDPRNNGDETLNRLIKVHGALPPTYAVRTGGGGNHYYYRADSSFYEDNDFPKIIGPGLELLSNHYVVAPPSTIDGSAGYLVAAGAIEEDFPRLPVRWISEAVSREQYKRYEQTWAPDDENWFISEGERDNTMTAIAGWCRRMGLNREEIEAVLTTLLPRFEGSEEMATAIPRIARSIMRYPPEGIRFNDLRLTMKPRRREPELNRNALHGPIGEWVKRVEPISEAHPAALFTQALAAFGNIIGARRHGDDAPGFTVEDTRHRTSLYVNIIGDSAKSGKGDSWSRVRAFMQKVDPSWLPASGVQTGEGLIDALADDEETVEKTIINGEPVHHRKKGGQENRRYFIIEPEFGRLLHTASRQGATLKDVYRDLWDEGSTAKVTAGQKHRVTEATVSLVAHITKPELERDLDPVDLLSGFGNRFIHVYTKRTKTLPSAPPLPATPEFVSQLRESLDFAHYEAPSNYSFTRSAYAYWEDLCEEFAKPHPSIIVDALTARARPIVRRIAVILAVADLASQIHIEHLESAYHLWQYSLQSIEFIFGSMIGNRDADKIYHALLEHRAGLSQTEIHLKIFNGNRSAAQLEKAYKMLTERGMIQCRSERKGRKSSKIYFINPSSLEE